MDSIAKLTHHIWRIPYEYCEAYYLKICFTHLGALEEEHIPLHNCLRTDLEELHNLRNCKEIRTE